MSKVVNLEFMIKSAAKDLDLDPVLLQHLAYHQYQFIRKFHSNPTSPVLSIKKFGTFEIRRNKFYNNVIGKIIPYVREHRTPTAYKILKQCLDFRPILNYYYSLRSYKVKDEVSGQYRNAKVKIGDNQFDVNICGEVSDKELISPSTGVI